MIQFYDLQVGGIYRMTGDGGDRFSRGDRVVILSKVPGSQFAGSEIHCSRVTDNRVFRVSGASWFAPDTDVEG